MHTAQCNFLLSIFPDKFSLPLVAAKIKIWEIELAFIRDDYFANKASMNIEALRASIRKRLVSFELPL